MAEIVWTEPALSDLNDIAEYIALNNPEAAKTLVQSIFATTERLDTFPKSGHIPPELEGLDYREILITPCRIFYKYNANKDHVNILHVMREERDLVKFLGKQ